MLSTKLSAFTIIEVTVAMLLGAISIGISYTAYSMIARSYKEYDKKNKKISEVLLADKMLKQDITTSQKLITIANGFLAQTQQGQIEYRFTPDYILRDQYQLRRDTFFIANSQFLSTFENADSFPGEMADKISLSIHVDNKDVPLIYMKEYSGEELFEK